MNRKYYVLDKWGNPIKKKWYRENNQVVKDLSDVKLSGENK